MTLIALVWLALWVDAPPDTVPQLVAVVHDEHRGITAGLALSDAAAVSATDFERIGDALFVRARDIGQSAPPDDDALGTLLGHAWGPDQTVARFHRQVLGWRQPHHWAGVVAAADGIGGYEGIACDPCRAEARSRAAVATVGLRADVARVVVPMLDAVHGDPVEALLDLAARDGEFWGSPLGARSAMLVVFGGGSADEVIAVDRHGAVGRRLIERHLRHLADVELPHQIAEARAAAARGDAPAFAEHRSRALAVADRTLQALGPDRTIVGRKATAEALRGP